MGETSASKRNKGHRQKKGVICLKLKPDGNCHENYVQQK